MLHLCLMLKAWKTAKKGSPPNGLKQQNMCTYSKLPISNFNSKHKSLPKLSRWALLFYRPSVPNFLVLAHRFLVWAESVVPFHALTRAVLMSPRLQGDSINSCCRMEHPARHAPTPWSMGPGQVWLQRSPGSAQRTRAPRASWLRGKNHLEL